MATAREQMMQGLSPEQWEALHAYRMALRMHDGRYLVIPRIITLPTPAAGVDFDAFGPPAGKTWLPLSIRGRLTTSAVVATRSATLFLTDGSTSVGYASGAATVAASGATTLGFLRGLGDHVTVTGFLSVSALPPIPVPNGVAIKFTTVNLDVGDQWSLGSIYVLEIRERTANEMVSFAEDLASGAHVDLYPGLLLGL